MTITTEQLKDQIKILQETAVPGETDYFHLIALRELLAVREAVHVVEPDYIRRDCGCCGFESLNYFQDSAACPRCNHTPLGKTELFIAPPAVPDECPAEIRDLIASHSDALFNDGDAQKIFSAAPQCW